MLPASALGACLIARNRVKQVAVFNVLSRLFMLGAVLTAVLIWRTPTAAVVGTVVGAGIVLLPALKLMFAACNVGSLMPITNSMLSQLKYAAPLGLAGMIGTISKNLDKVVVSSMCTPESFAVYVNGAIEIPLIGIITGSVMSILLPEFATMYKRGEHREILNLWHRAMVKCALLIFPIMIFLFLMAPELIRALFSVKYVESVHPFRIYVLELPIRITQYGAIIMAAGRSKLILYRSIGGLVLNLFLSIVLITILGSIGAAMSTVILSYIFSLPLNIFFISRILKIEMRIVMPISLLTKIIIVSAGAGVVLLLAPLVRPLGDVLSLAILGTSYAIATLVLFDRFKFIELKDVLHSIKSRVLPK